jgi:energy-coupling factor transporter ATP-binding protein EcfA2
MKILMLGHSGVGKTTYMASMYGTLQEGIDGFSLRAEDESVGNDLLTIAQAIARNQYPKPTDQRGEYRFKLRYEDKSFFEFTWIDYRGGVFKEGSASSQVQQLLEDLKKADGILVFCDGEALARGEKGDAEIGRMMSLIGQALARIDKPIPLAVILTKSDLVPRVNGHLPAPLLGLQEAVSASGTVSGTFIRVACGRRPANVEKPVLFVLQQGIQNRVSHLRGQVKGHEQRKRALESQANVFDDFFSWVFNERSYRDLAAEQAEEARKLLRKIEPLTLPAQALSEHLEGLTVF